MSKLHLSREPRKEAPETGSWAEAAEQGHEKKKLMDKKAGRIIRNSAIRVRLWIWSKLRIRTGVKIRIRTRTRIRIRTRIGTRPRAQARVMLYMNTDRARTALTESSRR